MRLTGEQAGPLPVLPATNYTKARAPSYQDFLRTNWLDFNIYGPMEGHATSTHGRTVVATHSSSKWWRNKRQPFAAWKAAKRKASSNQLPCRGHRNRCPQSYLCNYVFLVYMDIQHQKYLWQDGMPVRFEIVFEKNNFLIWNYLFQKQIQSSFSPHSKPICAGS